jgi:hypothetical protein
VKADQYVPGPHSDECWCVDCKLDRQLASRVTAPNEQRMRSPCKVHRWSTWSREIYTSTPCLVRRCRRCDTVQTKA